MKYFEYLKKHK